MMEGKITAVFKFFITTAAIMLASVIFWNLYTYYNYAPQTRDGKIRADVVPLATDISGIVDEIFVNDNQIVKKGTLLFRLDKKRLSSVVEQTKAGVEQYRATLSAAEREYKRYLGIKNAVSAQQLDDQRDAVIMAQANLDKALADYDLAQINLSRTNIYSPVDGIITNFSLRAGTYATAGVPIMSLIDQHSFYVAGYFEETKLSRISNGAKATISVMGESQPLSGHVEGLSAGINDSERTTASGTLLANVNPTFSWIRLAQRIPVRIKIDSVPTDFNLIAGRTASVTLAEITK